MKVSIVCPTYNHEAFIEDALKNFVNQETNFEFEIIVHDDASTDNTAKIIKKYETEYPHLIKPIYQTENQWRSRSKLGKTFIYPQIKGEYVIFCEGDDYFVSPHKLQKQVDFLDAHPDYSICFHFVEIIWADGSHQPTIFPSKKMAMENNFSFETLKEDNFIQTNSCMYRWRFHKENINELLPDNIIPGDYYLHLLHAQVGKIGFIPEVMANYRRHQNGVWTGANLEATWFVKHGLLSMNFYAAMEKNFNTDKNMELETLADGLLLSALSLDNKHALICFSNKHPQRLKNAFKRLQERCANGNNTQKMLLIKALKFLGPRMNLN